MKTNENKIRYLQAFMRFFLGDKSLNYFNPVQFVSGYLGTFTGIIIPLQNKRNNINLS